MINFILKSVFYKIWRSNLALLIVILNFSAQTSTAQWVRKDTGIIGNVQTMASSGGNLFIGSSSGGFFVSANGGTTWVASNSGLSTLDIKSIVVSGTNLYAGTYGGGVFLSTDNGTSWIARNTGLGNLTILALYVNGSIVLAGTGSGIYRSVDNGANWTVATGAATGAFTSFLGSGTAIFTGKGGQGIFKSTDSGASWVAVNNGLFHFDITCFAGIGSLLMAGTNGGIYTTSDGGANWTRLTDQGAPSGNIISLATRSSTVFVGTQSAGLLMSTNSGVSWFSASFPSTSAIVFNAGAPNVFASTSPNELWARPYTEFVIIDSFTPSNGTTGSSVTIHGSGFSSTPANNIVTFNGSTAATITSASPTMLTVTVPLSATSGPIDVTVGSLTARSLTDFTYITLHTVTGFSPASGPEGTVVTITGTGFSTTPSNNTVLFSGITGALPGTVTASTSTSVTAIVPAGAVTGNFSVLVNSFTVTSPSNFIVEPVITSFTPSSGLPGVQVTISGTGFSDVAGNNIVRFNGTLATVATSTPTSITTTVPAGATTGIISVTVGSLTSTSISNFIVPPTVTSFTPASGSVGTAITITGTNFSATPANNIVSFNGTVAPVGTSTTTNITLFVPNGATTGPISVTVNSLTGTSASNFIIAPAIASFTPTNGPVGTTVTITGTNFSTTPANNTVRFNGTISTVTASTATSITTTVPAGATSGAIIVTVSSLSAASASNFTVILPPSITNFSPVSGSEGAPVIITGTNFSVTPSNNTVRFNGTIATVTASTSTSITTSVPVGATTGSISVTVNSLTGTSASNFTVTDSTLPIVINNTISSVEKTGSISITASLSDAESGITSANVLYRFISDGGPFITVALVPGTGTVYTQTIVVNPTEELGLEYKYDVTNGAGLKNDEILFTVKISTTGSGLEIPYSAPGTDISNYRIVAVPMDITSKTVGEVFNEFGALNDSRWRLSHFRAGSNNELNLSSVIEPGLGYWLIAKEDPGTINSGAGTAVTASATSPFEIVLSAGWNQIGNPYNFNLSWADVQAANPGLSGLRKYEGTFIDAPVLNKMEGGFVNVLSARTIIVPVQKNASVNGGRTAHSGAFVNALSEKSWQVYLELTQGSLKNRIAGFGMHESASEGVDCYDGLTMPRFFGKWLEVNHKKQNNTKPFFSKDIVPTSENYVWEFLIETSEADQAMTFTWDNSYFGEKGPEIVLWDKVLQREVDMRATNQYTFSKNSKSFRIAFGNSDFVKKETADSQVMLYPAWPNPAQPTDEVTIAFSIPESSINEVVQLSILDILGQNIWQTTDSFTGGYHELKWRLGNIERSGLYIVTLKVGNIRKHIRVVLK